MSLASDKRKFINYFDAGYWNLPPIFGNLKTFFQKSGLFTIGYVTIFLEMEILMSRLFSK